MSNDLIRMKMKMERRHFLTRTSLGLGALAFGGLLRGSNAATLDTVPQLFPHFSAKVKRVVFLFMSGGPSQMDLFDHKPMLAKMHGQNLPESVRKGQRLTGMSSQQSSFPITASLFPFKQYGESGTWVSDLMPHTSEIVDDLCIIKSMHTEQINHDPAITFMQTGHQLAGRPSMGSWMSYGLGSENENLPNFIVMVSKNSRGQPLQARLWGNGFLPSHHQGVQFRSGPDPVLFMNNPTGYDGNDRKDMLNHLQKLSKFQEEDYNDPSISHRLQQFELAYRMQTSIPDVMDMADESDDTYDLYGPDSRDPGTYAANCLLARKLLEKGVGFVQLYHQGWDHHNFLPSGIRQKCKETDQATAALVKDLKRKGMLEDTLVIWGGEFGRTSYSQGKLTNENYGRDHHPRCFTMWMAGAGVKAGFTFGETDDFSYNVVKDPVSVHDFHATLLHLLGIDHERLTYKYQGRRYRLTDVHGQVVRSILS